MATFTCALCGDRMEDVPDGGFAVPPVCVELLDGDASVDPASIHGVVSIDFCGACTDIARRMIEEYDTSPLPECDLEAARYNERGTLAAFNDTTKGDPETRTIADAVKTATTYADGGTDRRLDGKTLEARAVVLSMELLEDADATAS